MQDDTTIYMQCPDVHPVKMSFLINQYKNKYICIKNHTIRLDGINRRHVQ